MSHFACHQCENENLRAIWIVNTVVHTIDTRRVYNYVEDHSDAVYLSKRWIYEYLIEQKVTSIGPEFMRLNVYLLMRRLQAKIP